MNLTEEVKKDAKIVVKDLKGNDNYLTSSTVLAGIATFIVLGILIYQYISTSALLENALKILRLQQQQVAVTTPAPTPTPIPLPRGPREFSVSGGDNPSIRSLKFSEYSPRKGENQTITVTVSDESDAGVLGVQIALMTDHEVKNYPLKLASGTAQRGDWSITITSNDTHDYVYGIDITAKNSKGRTNMVEPRFR